MKLTNGIYQPTGLTKEELINLHKASRDVFFFSKFIWVIHPMLGRIPFALYPYQMKLLWHFLVDRFTIILKFRQAGVTELISMYCLWLALCHPHKVIQIISIKDRVAKKVLKKIKFMYNNLPKYMQVPIINGRPGDLGTMQELEFANGSIITSLPTTEDAGRSEALSLLVIDEAAIVRWANTIWAAAFPTLSTGGQAIVNSCITGDTEIVGRHGNFRVEQICPKEFGIQDISFMGLEVLTHKLQWKKALYGVNKGILETWEVQDEQGNSLKCTPAHKLLTPQGWKSVSDIILHNLYVISYKSGINPIKEIPTTATPTSDLQLVGYIKWLGLRCEYPDLIIEKVAKKFNRLVNRSYISRVLSGRRNKNVTLSHIKLIRKYSDTIYDLTVEGDESYISTSNYISHNTPLGMGNWYHKTYTGAVSKTNNFIPIRLRWDMHPDHDISWYESMSKALGPRRTAQEIDGDFLTSGNSVFDLSCIKAIEDLIPDHLVVRSEFNGRYQVIEEPKPGVSYFIGADVATGRSKDFSAFSIMDKYGDEKAYYKGKISTNGFADLLCREGKRYNNALVAPETNDIGEAVTRIMQLHGYPKLFYFSKLLKAKGERVPKEEKFPGWLTTSKNRPIIITELEEDIRLENNDIKDPFFVQEAYTFIYDNSNRPVAMGKDNRTEGDEEDENFTDDSIMAKAITNFIRKGKINGTVVAPQ